MISAMLLPLVAIAPAGATTKWMATPAAAAPGQLVRWEPIPPIGAHPAWRVLYTSTNLDGSISAISGIIAIPNQPIPADGFPLLAVAHPTAGLGRECAPSLLLQQNDSLMAGLYQHYLTPYLDAGFAIVMPDYQGLGTEGDASYLIGAIEGPNLLDAIRAARQFSLTSLSDQTLLISHSQGGHATAFALQMAPTYAPELSIDGAVLAAPALDPGAIFRSLIESNDASEDISLILFVMAAWSATYPEASLEQVTTPTGQALIETEIANACLIEAGVAAEPYQPSELFLPSADLAWTDLVTENTPAGGPWQPPVLIVQGTADEVIDPAQTAEFVRQLCASGSTVEYVEIPGATHFGVLTESLPLMSEWLQDRVAGLPAPSSCPA